MASPDALVYHERQEAALCGVHALNNLVQTQAWTEFELAEIAHELDEAERTLMLSQGADTADAIKFLAEGSTNVDDSGNFSITVLREAVGRRFGLEMSSEDADVHRALQDPTAFPAYVLNLREHWFVIRSVHGVYLNMDSMLKAPSVISDFYLAAYLAQMRGQGYYIFCVKGSLPGSPASMAVFPLHLLGRLHRMGDIRAGRANKDAENARKAAKRHAAAAAEEDPEFAAALAASLAMAESRSGGGGAGGVGAGGGAYSSFGGSSGAGGGGAGAGYIDVDGLDAVAAGMGGIDEDEQLRIALAASLADTSGKGSGGSGAGVAAAGHVPSPGKRPASMISPSSGVSPDGTGTGATGTGAASGTGAGAGAGAGRSGLPSHLGGAGGRLATGGGPGSGGAAAEDEDEELQRALALSMGMTAAAGPAAGGATSASAAAAQVPTETAAEAVARLSAALPPEPGVGEEGSVRLALRLPAGMPMSASIAGDARACARLGLKHGGLGPAGASSSSTGAWQPAAKDLSLQRRFRREDGLAHVFAWAEAEWLRLWALPGAAADGGAAAAGGAGAAASPQPLPSLPFSLVMQGMPPKALTRPAEGPASAGVTAAGSEGGAAAAAAGGGAEAGAGAAAAGPALTVAAAGLAPSAALTLKPL